MYDVFMGEIKNEVVRELEKVANAFENSKNVDAFKSKFNKWFQDTIKNKVQY